MFCPFLCRNMHADTANIQLGSQINFHAYKFFVVESWSETIGTMLETEYAICPGPVYSFWFAFCGAGRKSKGDVVQKTPANGEASHYKSTITQLTATKESVEIAHHIPVLHCLGCSQRYLFSFSVETCPLMTSQWSVARYSDKLRLANSSPTDIYHQQQLGCFVL